MQIRITLLSTGYQTITFLFNNLQKFHTLIHHEVSFSDISHNDIIRKTAQNNHNSSTCDQNQQTKTQGGFTLKHFKIQACCQREAFPVMDCCSKTCQYLLLKISPLMHPCMHYGYYSMYCYSAQTY